MASRYRGRQRMISQAVGDSADFDGLSLAGTVLWVQMVVNSSDRGTTCIDAGWCKRRYFHRRGINRVTIHTIGQAIDLLIGRGILHPIPHSEHRAYDIQSPLSHALIRKFTAHNRVNSPGRQDETRQDETRRDDKAEVVEALSREFLARHDLALDSVNRLGTTLPDVVAWVQFADRYEAKGVNDRRRFLRDYVLRYRRPEDAPLKASTNGRAAGGDW